MQKVWKKGGHAISKTYEVYIIPMFNSMPLFALLYSIDEVVVYPAITIKFIGHQWWASNLPYEYSDYKSSDEQSLTFDSYTIPQDDIELGQSRFFEVNNRISKEPYIWVVPSLGVKCDAVPGRLNQTSISVQREGVYYEAVPRKDYVSRVSN
uniref:Cytochrome c oxidase polypeptide II n=1 Tax=Solanum lycopersicum TaxID=4081 RepID=A0A3Q7HDQ1_SOLLC